MYFQHTNGIYIKGEFYFYESENFFIYKMKILL